MKLYGHRGSPFVRKALVVLEEKGLRYQSVELSSVPGRKSPELLELHPLGKTPVPRDGDVVPDSSVCAYLEKKHPTPALYPDEPADLARALFLEEYSDTRLFEVLSGILFERMVKPRVMGQPPDEARVEHLTLSGLAIDRSRWRRSARYHEALRSRPSFVSAMRP